MRDAISLLELCAGSDGSGNGADGTSPSGIDAVTVRSIAGTGGRDIATSLIESIQRKDYDAIFEAVDSVCSSAGDLTVFWQDVMDIYRDMLVIRTTKNSSKYLDLTADEAQQLTELANTFGGQKLLRHCGLLEDAFIMMQRSNASKRLCAEMTLIKMCDDKLDTVPEGLAARVSALEEKLASGGFSEAVASKDTVMYQKSVSPEPKAAQDAAKTAKSESTEPVVPPTQKKAPAAITPKKGGLRPVSWWAEAMQRMDPSVASFFRLSRAYMDGNKIVIRADGQFAIMMMDTPEMRQTLSELSARYAPDKMCLPSDFEFIDIHSSDGEKFTALDELMSEINGEEDSE